MAITNNHNHIEEFYVCPVCGALCVEGHDDDFQQHCANCHKSFLGTNSQVVSLPEGAIKNGYICHEMSSWICYTPITPN